MTGNQTPKEYRDLDIHRLHADLTSAARSSRSQSPSSSMSLCHEQGLTPFPLSQCWNMSLQHASGSLGCVALITANLVPFMSNSNWSPSLCHFGVTVSMILIFFPEAFSRDSFPSVGVASVCVEGRRERERERERERRWYV